MAIDEHDLCKRFGTPLYVYDLERVRQQARALQAAIDYQPLRLLYAIKANPCPPVARTLIELGFGVDAVSPGEVRLAERLGCPAERILYTENNATDADLQHAIHHGVLVNCGSLDRLEACARLGATTAAVRINPDIGDSEHAHTLTAGPLTKFGVHHSQVAEIAALEQRSGIKVVGAHMHIGSNVLDAQSFVDAMAVILSAAKQLPNLEFIDFGGGLGVPYKPDQQAVDLARVGQAAGDLMREFCAGYGREIELLLEPGRFLVAEAGTLYTRITSIKSNPKTDEAHSGRTFVGCDTGFNHLLRPAMYGSWHPISNLTHPDAAPQVVDVVGNVCESGDVFARDRELPTPELGDLFAIGCAGAYGMSMASTYNLRPLPAEITIDGDEVTVARKRRSIDDLIEDWETI